MLKSSFSNMRIFKPKVHIEILLLNLENNNDISIIKDCCHVVPISSSPLNPESGCEWRISFSKAEQQLVSSMNQRTNEPMNHNNRFSN